MTDRNHEIHEEVKQYYSEVTKKRGGELASAVCSCAANGMPDIVKRTAAQLPDEILTRYYGCGSPIPDRIEGCTVLDLGCGTGRDVYVAAKLTGPAGRVIGIDMNDDQLAIARKYQDEMAEKWGYSNVEFRKGYIEDLADAGIADGSVDVVISNCVINLSPDKDSVFSEIRRVLREGGVLYFSDIFADRHVPDEINRNPLLVGECMGGSLSHDEFRQIMTDKGFLDYTVVSSAVSPIDNPEIEALVGDIRYTSETIRAVKCSIAVPYPEAYQGCGCGSEDPEEECCCGDDDNASECGCGGTEPAAESGCCCGSDNASGSEDNCCGETVPEPAAAQKTETGNGGGCCCGSC